MFARHKSNKTSANFCPCLTRSIGYLLNRLAVVAARFLAACTPGYYNNEGHFGEPGSGGLGAGAYAPGINAFNALMAKWREKGDLEGLEIG